MPKKRTPPPPKRKSRKSKYIKPLLTAGGSLLAMTAKGIAPRVIICCLTERLRASLRSADARNRLMKDAIAIAAHA